MPSRFCNELPQKINVTKMQAARRQLRTAITLWFANGDPISIHALAYAAYEVLHRISKEMNPSRRDLLFDSRLIKEEFRKDWNLRLKKPANFFKHADRDSSEILEFDVEEPIGFIVFAITAISTCGKGLSDEESAFMFFAGFHNADLLTGVGRETFTNAIPIEQRDWLKSLSRKEFFDFTMAARVIARQDGRLPPNDI